MCVMKAELSLLWQRFASEDFELDIVPPNGKLVCRKFFVSELLPRCKSRWKRVSCNAPTREPKWDNSRRPNYLILCWLAELLWELFQGLLVEAVTIFKTRIQEFRGISKHLRSYRKSSDGIFATEFTPKFSWSRSTYWNILHRSREDILTLAMFLGDASCTFD